MTDWHELINLGVPMLILGAVAVTLYKAMVYMGHRLFDEEKGVVCQWVGHERKWRETLTDRLEHQTATCNVHAQTQLEINDSVRAMAESTQVSSSHLARLVDLHESPTGMVSQSIQATQQTCKDVQQLKSAVVHACEMCRRISEREFPNSAPEVAQHCDKIEQVIKDA